MLLGMLSRGSQKPCGPDGNHRVGCHMSGTWRCFFCAGLPLYEASTPVKHITWSTAPHIHWSSLHSLPACCEAGISRWLRCSPCLRSLQSRGRAVLYPPHYASRNLSRCSRNICWLNRGQAFPHQSESSPSLAPRKAHRLEGAAAEQEQPHLSFPPGAF